MKRSPSPDEPTCRRRRAVEIRTVRPPHPTSQHKTSPNLTGVPLTAPAALKECTGPVFVGARGVC
jgi:hypothetical protein